TNLTSGKTIVFKHNPMDSTSISNNVIYNVYFDKQGFLWLSTFDGLNKFDTKTYKSIIYKHHSANKKSLNTNKIFAIYQDNSMDYWIGTIGGGLNYINHKTNEITSFTTKEGLSNNIVYDIIDDNFGNLWLSTNCGISSFNLKNKVFTNYTVSDGLQSNEFNFGAALKDNFGNIYFGGMFGFNVLKPKDIQIASNNLKMLISEFSVNNGTTIYYVLPKETIRLNYNQNSFSIRFS
ncbi:MAG: hybrid sensor histidine kinase/response regulator, partial [Candidatus Nealsonbacteria bacterium CG_4_10_14_0_8_um_filter_35_10]